MKNDWFFQNENYICSFRTAGVLIHDKKIFVQRDKDGCEYALPGGHVVIGETSAESLIREFQEEIGVDIICKRLIWTEECFWTWNNKQAITLAFYYLIALTKENAIPDRGEFVPQKDNDQVVFGWIPIEDLQHIKIYPSFIKDKIYCLENYPEHFITKE